MKDAFARDAEGNIKTKKGCQTPGCDYPTWHICLAKMPPVDPEVQRKHDLAAAGPGRGARKGRSLAPRSQEYKDAIAEAQRKRWASKNRARDEKIVARFLEGNIGKTALAEEFGISRTTLIRALKNAEAEGLIPAGSTGGGEGRPQEHRDAISASLKRRWAEKHKERDEKIVALYTEGGISSTDVGRQFGLGRDAVLRILKDAEEREGRSIVRKPGKNVIHGA